MGLIQHITACFLHKIIVREGLVAIYEWVLMCLMQHSMYLEAIELLCETSAAKEPGVKKIVSYKMWCELAHMTQKKTKRMNFMQVHTRNHKRAAG